MGKCRRIKRNTAGQLVMKWLSDTWEVFCLFALMLFSMYLLSIFLAFFPCMYGKKVFVTSALRAHESFCNECEAVLILDIIL